MLVVCAVVLLLVVVQLMIAPPVCAQTDAGQLIFTAGTTITNDAGDQWAYLLWQATDSRLLEGRYFAVYSKTGDVDSANTFILRGVNGLQDDPKTILMLLNRSTNLGQDLASLESDIDELFDGLGVDPSLTLQEKLVEIILGSQVDDQVYDNLALLAKIHPAVAMAMGHAFAGEIASSGKSTFEIRDWNYSAGTPGPVLGRVTVEADAPTVLPAPIDLLEVPDESPMGDLNVRLRWTSPDKLRRLALLGFGYSVYRMTSTFVSNNNYHLVSPATTALLYHVENDAADVKKLNALPVLVDEEESTTNDYFFIDDNGRFKDGGTPLTDRDLYFYFVTALDILGRDGLVSTGRLVQVCDRMPPPSPRSVKVTREHTFTNGMALNSMRVTWKQVPDGSEGVTNYYVYRWASISNQQALGASTSQNLIAGPIPHIPGTNYNSYLDLDIATAEVGRTYWYTVQATDQGSCGVNFSGHSAPAGNHIQDWDPPSAPTGHVNIICSTPIVTFDQTVTKPRVGDDVEFTVECQRLDPHIRWAEFYHVDEDHSTTSGLANAKSYGLHYYPSGISNIAVQVEQTGTPMNATFFVRVGTSRGKVSEWALKSVTKPVTSMTMTVSFDANVLYQDVRVNSACDEHEPDIDGDFIIDAWPRVTLHQTDPDALEYRLYRIIDSGAPTLIAQGTNVPLAVTTIVDRVAGPLFCGKIFYFALSLDHHGNESETTILWTNGFESAIQDPPIPQLIPLAARGSADSPTMHVEWVCSPYGVERFEVWIGTETGDPPVSISSDLSTNTVPTNVVESVSVGGLERDIAFGVYVTPRIGTAFGSPGDANFELDIPIDANRKYYVRIKAVGVCGPSTESIVESLLWYQPSLEGPDVPWPARGMPQVLGGFHDSMKPFFLFTTNYVIAHQLDFVGIRIGQFSAEFEPGTISKPYIIPGTVDPHGYLYKDERDDSLLMPFVLYRYQVANTELPRVSGDVVQVSPMMELMAHQIVGAPDNETRVHDPFIHVLPPPDTSMSELRYIYVGDTQPVIRGATYAYLVVLFNEYAEPYRVIPVGEVTIPIK